VGDFSLNSFSLSDFFDWMTWGFALQRMRQKAGFFVNTPGI
jgi:hypothetical protein